MLRSMRAAIAQSGQLSIADVDDPVPGPGEALVAVKACGICGSDLHTLQHGDAIVEATADMGGPLMFDPRQPYIMGHEFACEVLELGPGNDGAAIAPGDLVTSMPIVLGHDGSINTTAYSNTYNGGYADLMRLSSGLCLTVPNGLDPFRAAMTEPMAVGRHAVGRAEVTPQTTAVVHGCGPVGLAVIADLRRRGVETIVAADFSPRRRAVATAMGASEVVDPRDEPAVHAWRRVTGGLKPLVQFDAIGVPGIIDAAIKAAPPQSRLLVVGVCMEPDTVHPFFGIAKEIEIRFALAYDPMEFADTLRVIAEGELDVTPMLTGRCGVDAVPEAFAELSNPEGHVKIMVEPGGPARVQPLE
jgi:threonine dehydrogenase-like Zn-dependent dehydrogenase